MKITLKEARMQKSGLLKEIKALREQRESAATVELTPGEDFHDYISTTVEELTERIDEAIARVLRLSEVIQRENMRPRLVEGREVTIHSLITENILLQEEKNTFLKLSQKKPRFRSDRARFSRGFDTVFVTTYDIKGALQRANELTERCRRQSLLIDKLDQEILVDC